jgi:hypothetical protein
MPKPAPPKTAAPPVLAVHRPTRPLAIAVVPRPRVASRVHGGPLQATVKGAPRTTASRAAQHSPADGEASERS